EWYRAGADVDDGDAGPREGRGERHIGERLAHRGQRGLRFAVAARETEIPVVHVGSRSIPLVGPRVHERPGTAGGERAAYLPVEHAGLDVLAVAPAVEPELGHEEGAVTREGLQAREVGLEAMLR